MNSLITAKIKFFQIFPSLHRQLSSIKSPKKSIEADHASPPHKLRLFSANFRAHCKYM